MTTVDLVGPKGFTHGWHYVGVQDAVGYHGMKTVGINRKGQKIIGTYDHTKHQVVTRAGYRHSVQKVASWKQGAGNQTPEQVIHNQRSFREAVLSNIDLVGPEGFIHGWIHVGVGSNSPAATLHGKKVTGLTATGSKIAGVYDHIRHEVITAQGGRHSVTHIMSPGQDQSTRGAAGATIDQRRKAAVSAATGRMLGMSNAIGFATDPTSTAGRQAALKAGNALSPPSPGAPPGYPITSGDQWDKARDAVGRVKDPKRRMQLAKLLQKTAPQFGRQQALAGSWAAPGGAANMSNIHDFAAGPTTYSRDPDENVRCQSCGLYNDDDAKYCDQCGAKLMPSAYNDGTPDFDSDAGDGVLRTPQPAGLQSAAGFNAAQIGLANAVELAQRVPVASHSDVLISRGSNGRAVIRHRRGGDKIGEVFRTGDGAWTSALGEDGKHLTPHTHQRGALAELISTWNTGTGSLHRPAAGPALQPPAQQTPLMAQYGVPAVRALATPTTGASDGPRATMNGSTDDTPAGLTPKGVTIYKKLKAKGFPPDRALQFARRAQSFGGPKGS